jgi:hypothetical protein
MRTGNGLSKHPIANFRSLNAHQMKSAETGEYLELANRCLIEASRTLDREAADTLRHLAKRYFKEADHHKDE